MHKPHPLEKLFTNKDLFMQALTHRSWVNENSGKHDKNERLEFLGDAILELWTSVTLFNLFPSMNEGDLTNLRANIVRTESLAKIATTINLGSHILLSRG